MQTNIKKCSYKEIEYVHFMFLQTNMKKWSYKEKVCFYVDEY